MRRILLIYFSDFHSDRLSDASDAVQRHEAESEQKTTEG